MRHSETFKEFYEFQLFLGNSYEFIYDEKNADK